MEAFVLNHFSIILENVHAQFEIVPAVDILRHDTVICPIKEEFTKQLDRLALGDIGA